MKRREFIAGFGEAATEMRELIYIYLLVGLFTVSIWAIDPAPYITISAAAGTFTAFAVFQHMN
jgi:hypothetical protein